MDYSEELDVVRHHNRALRIVNKKLRKAQTKVQEYLDFMFFELCNSSSEAEQAFEKLWTRGGLHDNCGPQDYNQIAEFYLALLDKKSPIDESVQG